MLKHWRKEEKTLLSFRSCSCGQWLLLWTGNLRTKPYVEVEGREHYEVRVCRATSSGNTGKSNCPTVCVAYTKTSTFHLQATLKRYQTEHRNKLDSLEKSQAELKKIRRKSQGGRNALKYEHKEIEVNFSALLYFIVADLCSLQGSLLNSLSLYFICSLLCYCWS